MTTLDPVESAAVIPGRFSLRSFRAKFLMVVGAALLIDLVLSGGLAIYNVQHLSGDVTAEVGQGLTSTNQEFLRTYIDATAQRADLLIENIQSQLATLANTMQFVKDNPDSSAALNEAILADPKLNNPLQYNATQKWAQNGPGAPTAVDVWSYLLDANGVPVPKAQAEIRDSAVMSLLGPALMATGRPKLQMYYIGAKDASITRTVPYSDQTDTLDKVYPGYNKGPSFWDFFFPGVYEGWQSWLANPSSRPTDSDTVTTVPYVDSTSGSIVVTYFDPIYSPDRKSVVGGVAVDRTLDQLVSLVESVNIAQTGFGFLATSNGNVLATNTLGQKTLGLVSNDAATPQGAGVTSVIRSLSQSSQKEIASLQLPTDDKIVLRTINLEQNGEQVPYLVVLKQLAPSNLWDGKNIVKDTMSLGFAVSERDIYHSLIAAQNNIGTATRDIISYQIIFSIVMLLIVLTAVYAISGRITAGLSMLATAARRLQNKDYTVRVNVPTRDEVGAVGFAFNRMAEEIRYHTENLESLVEDRTRDLHKANAEITALNGRLKDENLRLGAELDIARQIQMMVLPKPNDLNNIPNVEVAGYMAPADEVGGDYFDVLHTGSSIKFGIGDVTGHGLESGVLMLMVQSVALALQEQGDDDPKLFLEVLNRAIYKNIERTQTDKHLSLAFLDYLPGKMILTGQHEEVLIIRTDGRSERIDTMDLGFPVGLQSDIGPFINTIDLPFDNGDIIVLYTDGITEAESEDGVLFGLEKLEESAIRHRGGDAETIKNNIISDVMAHIGTQTIHDDITLVVLRHR